MRVDDGRPLRRAPRPSEPQLGEADALEAAMKDWLSYHGNNRFQPNRQERDLMKAAYAAIARLRAIDGK